MRNTLLLFSFLMITMLSVSCSSSDNNNATPSFNWTGTAPLSVKINGVQYQATTGTAMKERGGVYLTSTNGSDTEVTVSFASVPTTGTTYNAPSPSNIAMTIQVQGGSGSGQWEAMSGGEIKVTGITDSTISGLFYGTLTDPTGASSATYKLTEGYFNVKIQ